MSESVFKLFRCVLTVYQGDLWMPGCPLSVSAGAYVVTKVVLGVTKGVLGVTKGAW